MHIAVRMDCANASPRIVLESQARTEPLLALYQARVRRSKLQTRFMAAIAIVVPGPAVKTVADVTFFG